MALLQGSAGLLGEAPAHWRLSAEAQFWRAAALLSRGVVPLADRPACATCSLLPAPRFRDPRSEIRDPGSGSLDTVNDRASTLPPTSVHES
jgi:hypothetical protein